MARKADFCAASAQILRISAFLAEKILRFSAELSFINIYIYKFDNKQIVEYTINVLVGGGIK